jgi:hypothetical protein
MFSALEVSEFGESNGQLPSAVLAALLDDGTLGQKHDLQRPCGENSSEAIAAMEENPHLQNGHVRIHSGESFG